mgnify:CR=1 FL=1|tara:strand:- start:323 stop:967 length:645 start_codon:yes stop_codon:yes gene_type:complete
MKVELIIPNNLNEVTLGQYQEYIKLKDLSEVEMSLKMIEIFCNLNSKQVRYLKATDVKEVVNIISQMFDSKPSLVNTFKINDIEYGFIPNLDEMSFGEYIDLDTYIGDWDNIEKAMGVLYRPIEMRKNNRYHLKEYEAGDSEHLKDMPLDAVLGSILFFYHLGNDLCRVTMNSLEVEEMEDLQQLLNLENVGGGSLAFINSLNQTLDNLNISLN